MARKFLTPIDLNGLELQNAVIQNLNGDPTAVTGKIYFNTVSNELKVYNGTSWGSVGSAPVAGNGISVAGSTVSVVAGNGIAVSSTGVAVQVQSDGGITSTSTGIVLDLATTSGLEIEAGEGLRIDLDSEPGLHLGPAGIRLKLDNTTNATSGLTIGNDGLRVDLATTSGLEFDSSGLKIDVASGASALELTSNGLSVQAATNGGISLGSGTGLELDLATTSGLEIEAGEGLRIDLDSEPGLQLSAAGIRLLLDNISGGNTSGLVVSSSGLKVDLATTSGLLLSGDGLAVDTSYIATKAYADGLAAGLDVKDSVFVATTTSGTLASSFENGDSVGGKTLATGKRILIKDQANPVENGIYIVNASGAPTRASDLATGSSARGVFVFVEEGTNSGKGFVCANPGDVVGTGSLTFTQFSDAGSLTASAGISIAGTNISVDKGDGLAFSGNTLVVQAVNQSIAVENAGIRVALADNSLTVTSSGLAVDLATTSGLEVASGDGLRIDLATSSGLELAAGGLTIDLAATSYLSIENDGLKVDTTTNGAVARKYSTTLAGSSTSYTVTHNFNTRAVQVQVYETDSPYATVDTDVERATTDTVTIKFATAPSSSAYSVVVVG